MEQEKNEREGPSTPALTYKWAPEGSTGVYTASFCDGSARVKIGLGVHIHSFLKPDNMEYTICIT